MSVDPTTLSTIQTKPGTGSLDSVSTAITISTQIPTSSLSATSIEYVDSSISSAISTIVAGADSAHDTLHEIQNIMNADEATVTGLISVIAGKASTGYVDSSIATEVSNRNIAISAAVTGEVTARNTAITSAIMTEVSNRNNAISGEVTSRNTAISTAISTAIANEVVARNTAISTAVSNISNSGGNGIATRMAISVSFVFPLTDGEALPGSILDAAVTFPQNFSSSLIRIAGSAPIASATHIINQIAIDGTVSQIGSLVVGTDRTVTLTTVATAAFTVPSGFGIQMVGPSPADGQLSNLIGELVGTYA